MYSLPRNIGPLAPYDKDGDNVDHATFEQILEMDDDEDEREFSRGIVFGFFDQAANTFAGMDKALKEKDLLELSSLGHFLKGSSATLGLSKVKDSCEKMQHFGAHKDESGNSVDESDEYFLDKTRQTLEQVKGEYSIAEGVLRNFYDGPGNLRDFNELEASQAIDEFVAIALVQREQLNIDAGFDMAGFEAGNWELVDGHVCRKDLATEAVLALAMNEGWMAKRLPMWEFDILEFW
ncbi:MAG: hypothetical protein Q9164_004422, partial [Protoblastenia rupestris]